MKLVICNDLHLNHASDKTRQKFYNKVFNLEPEAILLNGDMGDGPKSCKKMLDEFVQCACHDYTEIYFVMGNHDYYFSSFHKVEKSLMPMRMQGETL